MINSVQPVKIYFCTWLSRMLIFSLLWWCLTDGSLSSWLVGLPVALLASLVSVRLLPALSWSLSGLFYFVVFFFWHSLRGGTDVAWRAFHPNMPISPALHDFRFHLPPGLPRVFMANTVNLLPGTLSVEVDDKCLKVHVLDDTGAFESELHALEELLARMLKVELIKDNVECL